MTLAEKLAYVGGKDEFFVRGFERLGIPEIKMSDGPAGCRNWGPSTAYPAPIGIAASFDPALAERVGRSMARDCRARGVHVLLAPGVNLQRAPLNGRSFEYLGEDPLLASRVATRFVRGVQGGGVVATVKHFVANNQEWDRNHVSSQVAERTLREMYFPAFEAVVRDAEVGAVMTSYNPLNGTYASHHSWLLREVLRRQWGFSGVVMSDWGAVHDTLGAVRGGTDVEMPSGKLMNAETLTRRIDSGEVREEEIDEKVRRILAMAIRAGFFDRDQKRADVPLDDPQSAEVALDAARQSLVLLRNERATLPLSREHARRIAVIGPTAHPAVHGGSGSAYVTPFDAVSVLEGVRAAHREARVEHHPGIREISPLATLGKSVFEGPVRQEIFVGKDLGGAPVATEDVTRIDFDPRGKAPASGVGPENYSIRWTGKLRVEHAGKYALLTNADDGIAVFVDGKQVIDDWSDHAPRLQRVEVTLSAGLHDVRVEYFQGILGAVAQLGFSRVEGGPSFRGTDDVTALASMADVAIVCVGFGQSAETNSLGLPYEPFWPPGWARDAGLVEAEDSDRPFALHRAQVETIRVVAAASPRTVVVLTSGAAVDVAGWLDDVEALLWAGYPGQEGGTAIADVLFGDHDPEGKLPATFAKRFEDYPSASSYHVREGNQTPYAEGVLVGYRGFDAARIEPAFPFGFGLRYTTFHYAHPAVTRGEGGAVSVRFDVRNAGSRRGVEIAQVYVAPPSTTSPTRAPLSLGGFARVELDPGETRWVEVVLPWRAFAYWDGDWKVDPRAHEIRIGGSSRDLPLSVELQPLASP